MVLITAVILYVDVKKILFLVTVSTWDVSMARVTSYLCKISQIIDHTHNRSCIIDYYQVWALPCVLTDDFWYLFSKENLRN